jgi:hypothetical protein
MSFFKHLGQSSSKYYYSLYLHEITIPDNHIHYTPQHNNNNHILTTSNSSRDLNSANSGNNKTTLSNAAVYISIKKASSASLKGKSSEEKRSRIAITEEQNQIIFNEPIELVSTLYSTSDNKKFQPKAFGFTVKTEGAKSSNKPFDKLTTEIDIASFASKDSENLVEITKTFPLYPKSDAHSLLNHKSASQPNLNYPLLRITIRCKQISSSSTQAAIAAQVQKAIESAKKDENNINIHTKLGSPADNSRMLSFSEETLSLHNPQFSNNNTNNSSSKHADNAAGALSPRSQLSQVADKNSSLIHISAFPELSENPSSSPEVVHFTAGPNSASVAPVTPLIHTSPSPDPAMEGENLPLQHAAVAEGSESPENSANSQQILAQNDENGSESDADIADSPRGAGSRRKLPKPSNFNINRTAPADFHINPTLNLHRGASLEAPEAEFKMNYAATQSPLQLQRVGVDKIDENTTVNYVKRRSDTQIFNSIMLDNVVGTAADSTPIMALGNTGSALPMTPIHSNYNTMNSANPNFGSSFDNFNTAGSDLASQISAARYAEANNRRSSQVDSVLSYNYGAGAEYNYTEAGGEEEFGRTNNTLESDWSVDDVLSSGTAFETDKPTENNENEQKPRHTRSLSLYKQNPGAGIGSKLNFLANLSGNKERQYSATQTLESSAVVESPRPLSVATNSNSTVLSAGAAETEENVRNQSNKQGLFKKMADKVKNVKKFNSPKQKQREINSAEPPSSPAVTGGSNNSPQAPHSARSKAAQHRSNRLTRSPQSSRQNSMDKETVAALNPHLSVDSAQSGNLAALRASHNRGKSYGELLSVADAFNPKQNSNSIRETDENSSESENHQESHSREHSKNGKERGKRQLFEENSGFIVPQALSAKERQQRAAARATQLNISNSAGSNQTAPAAILNRMNMITAGLSPSRPTAASTPATLSKPIISTANSEDSSSQSSATSSQLSISRLLQRRTSGFDFPLHPHATLDAAVKKEMEFKQCVRNSLDLLINITVFNKVPGTEKAKKSASSLFDALKRGKSKPNKSPTKSTNPFDGADSVQISSAEPNGPKLEAVKYWNNIPTAACTILRCLIHWEAFSTFIDEKYLAASSNVSLRHTVGTNLAASPINAASIGNSFIPPSNITAQQVNSNLNNNLGADSSPALPSLHSSSSTGSLLSLAQLPLQRSNTTGLLHQPNAAHIAPLSSPTLTSWPAYLGPTRTWILSEFLAAIHNSILENRTNCSTLAELLTNLIVLLGMCKKHERWARERQRLEENKGKNPFEEKEVENKAEMPTAVATAALSSPDNPFAGHIKSSAAGHSGNPFTEDEEQEKNSSIENAAKNPFDAEEHETSAGQKDFQEKAPAAATRESEMQEAKPEELFSEKSCEPADQLYAIPCIDPNLQYDKKANKFYGKKSPEAFVYPGPGIMSAYHWFTLHLREAIGSTHQWLLENILHRTNDLNFDMKAVLETEGPDLGSPLLDQLLNIYTESYNELARANCPHTIKDQFIACLVANLSFSTFNLILETDSLITMCCGLKLQVIFTSLEEYATRTGGNALKQAIQPHIIRLKELALFLLTDKSAMTVNELAQLFPHLTTLQLCHLLKHYTGNDKAKPEFVEHLLLMRAAAGENYTADAENSSTLLLLDPKQPILINIDISMGRFVLSSASVNPALVADNNFSFLKQDSSLIL